MRDLDEEEIAAIAARTVAARDFVRIVGKDGSGDPVSRGFWIGIGTVLVPVVDRLTGAEASYSFHGDGALVSVGRIPLTADITVRSVDIVLSPLVAAANDYLRGYDLRNAPVQIWRGYLDPETKALIAPAKGRFVGFVDTMPFDTAAEGGESTVTLKCVSTTRELTRANPDVRSHESQQARHAGDDFARDVGVVGDWELFWGQTQGQVTG